MEQQHYPNNGSWGTVGGRTISYPQVIEPWGGMQSHGENSGGGQPLPPFATLQPAAGARYAMPVPELPPPMPYGYPTGPTASFVGSYLTSGSYPTGYQHQGVGVSEQQRAFGEGGDANNNLQLQTASHSSLEVQVGANIRPGWLAGVGEPAESSNASAALFMERARQPRAPEPIQPPGGASSSHPILTGLLTTTNNLNKAGERELHCAGAGQAKAVTADEPVSQAGSGPPVCQQREIPESMLRGIGGVVRAHYVRDKVKLRMAKRRALSEWRDDRPRVRARSSDKWFYRKRRVSPVFTPSHAGIDGLGGTPLAEAKFNMPFATEDGPEAVVKGVRELLTLIKRNFGVCIDNIMLLYLRGTATGTQVAEDLDFLNRRVLDLLQAHTSDYVEVLFQNEGAATREVAKQVRERQEELTMLGVVSQAKRNRQAGRKVLTTVVVREEPGPVPGDIMAQTTKGLAVVGKEVTEKKSSDPGKADAVVAPAPVLNSVPATLLTPVWPEAGRQEVPPARVPAALVEESAITAELDKGVGKRTRSGVARAFTALEASLLIISLLCSSFCMLPVVKAVGRSRGWVARLATIDMCSWPQRVAAQQSELDSCACHLQHRAERERAEKCRTWKFDDDVQQEECAGESSAPRCSHPEDKPSRGYKASPGRLSSAVVLICLLSRAAPLVVAGLVLASLPTTVEAASDARRWVEGRRDELSQKQRNSPVSVGYFLNQLITVLEKSENGDSAWEEQDRQVRDVQSQVDGHDMRLNTTRITLEALNISQGELYLRVGTLNETTDRRLNEWVLLVENQRKLTKEANATLDQHSKLLSRVTEAVFYNTRVSTAEVCFTALGTCFIAIFTWFSCSVTRNLRHQTKLTARMVVWTCENVPAWLSEGQRPDCLGPDGQVLRAGEGREGVVWDPSCQRDEQLMFSSWC